MNDSFRKRETLIFLRSIASLIFFSSIVFAQSPSADSTPVQVLYRLFFKEVEAFANVEGSFSAPGGQSDPVMKRWHEISLALTAAQSSALKNKAQACNRSLDEHQQLAAATIQAARAQRTLPGSDSPVVARLSALDSERKAISDACIADLRSALGDRTFNDIDVYVKSKFAQKVSLIAPKGAPFEGLPVKRSPVTVPSQGGAQ